ncbi:MAG TPA: serine/threonine-protein kinase [Candidatus Obscuribacterales bacterium]
MSGFNLTSIDSQTHVELCPNCGNQFPAQTGFCPTDGAQLLKQVPDPMIGMQLPRHYKIIEKVGRGAMSVVYRGVYEPLNQPVAIKLLKSHLVSDVQSFKRFQQEAKTAGALDHPHIAGVFDFGVTDQGVPYLIMELVQGSSLYGLLREPQRIPIARALRIFVQTADALAYTHDRGVIHRDVKPSNILVTQDENGVEYAKLVDFGIAKMQEYEGNPSLNLTQTGEVFGTPLYVSPEQAMGRALDTRADIYSLACVMYETVAGHPPFQAKTAFDVLRLQVQGNASPLQNTRSPGELPPSMVPIIERAMSKDPDARQQSMAELVHELQRCEVELAIAREAGSDGKSPLSSLTPTVAFTVMKQPAVLDAAGNVISQSRLPQAIETVARQAKSPLIPFAVSTLAGCLFGIGILLCVHPQSPPPPPLIYSSHLDADQAPAHASASIAADPQLAQLREHALGLYDQNKFDDAEKELKQAIGAAQAKKNSITEALLLADLCMVQIQLDKISDAYRSGSRAVNMLDSNSAVSQKDLSFALRAFGTVCFYRKDFGSAEDVLQRSVAIDKAVYGPSDERYAIGLARLAKVFESEKKFPEAEKAYREALSVSQKCHQPGDEHLALRMKSLAAFLRSRHHTAEALTLERKARKLDAETEQ